MRFVPALQNVVAYEPGLPIEVVKTRFGLERVVKLASNEFPLPPFPEVQEAIAAALDELHRYPDGRATPVREALSRHYGMDKDEIVVGAGSCELLYSLGAAFLEPGDEVVMADPSFSAYADVCDLHGAVAVRVPLIDCRHDLEAMAGAVTPRTKMVIVCNPNNPTGTYMPAAGVARLVGEVPDDVVVVVDEAYIEFVTQPDADGSLALQREHDNVIVLRTFSKLYGLCGLRIGYGLCRDELRQALDVCRQPFSVNRLAQVAAIEALEHQDRVVERRGSNAARRARMVEEFTARGRATVPSEANFMLVDIRDLCHPQEQVCGALLEMGAILRDGNALGCPGWARVSVGTDEEIDFLLDKLATLEVGATSARGGRTT